MSCNLSYPKMGLHKLPQKNVLVLSCIDLRLTDNLVDFLHLDNLANRYDHVTLAGTSLVTQIESKNLQHFFDPAKKASLATKGVSDLKSWAITWKDHVRLAIILHDIKDIYIVEHQNCGAYDNLLHKKVLAGNEKQLHKKFAVALATDIHKLWKNLYVHGFFIDLRGNVEHLFSTPKTNKP